jgi:hypothetical protein
MTPPLRPPASAGARRDPGHSSSGLTAPHGLHLMGNACAPALLMSHRQRICEQAMRPEVQAAPASSDIMTGSERRW